MTLYFLSRNKIYELNIKLRKIELKQKKVIIKKKNDKVVKRCMEAV